MSRIYLLPLTRMPEKLMDLLHARVEEIEDSTTLPIASAPDISSCYDRERGQYNSTSALLLLREIAKRTGAEPDKLLAVIGHDLFVPVLTFVFGEAELRGKAAIVSFYRLENERYGLPHDERLLVDRLVKEALHEIGHLYGLIHCHTRGCVMQASTGVEQIDLKTEFFCETCRNALPARGAPKEPRRTEAVRRTGFIDRRDPAARAG